VCVCVCVCVCVYVIGGFAVMYSVLLLMLLLSTDSATAVFINDYYPQEYNEGSLIPIKANSMVSSRHPNEPQDYYMLGFCEPDRQEIRAARRAENLGEILIGDKVLPTRYAVEMRIDKQHVDVCNRTYSSDDIEPFKRLVSGGYRVRWMLDSLPNLQPLKLKDRQGGHTLSLYEQGYDLGYLPGEGCGVDSSDADSSCSEEDTDDGVYLYSHIHIEVDFHGRRIVGFRTLPSKPVLLQVGGDEVFWSYSVRWKESEQEWGSRWDVYGLSNMEGKSVYILSTLISMLLILFSTMALKNGLDRRILKSLGMDKSHYSVFDMGNNMHLVTAELEEPDIEPYTVTDELPGWMLVSGQVYLPPKLPELLCALVGSGIQLLVIILFTAVLALLGIVYAAHRGLLINCIVVSFFITSSVCGYTSAWLYKSLALRRRDDLANFLTSFFLLPVLLLIIIFGVNLMLQHRHASSSIYWSTLGFIIFAWLCISFFTFTGGYYLGKSRRVSQRAIDRIIETVPASTATRGPARHALRLLIGLLSFATLWIPLKFIYMSIWGNMFYQLYALQWVSMLLWLFFTAELCIVYVFWQLNAQNHRWWWSSYAAGISVTLPTLLYSIVYYAMNSDITSFASLVIYFGYATVFSLVIMLLSGSVCFLASLFFVKRVCLLRKVD